MDKSLETNEIVDRIFFLFRTITGEVAADMLGITPATLSGWKKGKSSPRLPQLHEICEKWHVDWSWLLTGKTTDIEAIISAYWPIHLKPELQTRRYYYDHARHFSGFCIWPNSLHNIDKEVHAVAAFWRAAMEEDAPSPLYHANPNEIGTEDYIIEVAQGTAVPEEWLKKTWEKVRKMRACYIDTNPHLLPGTDERIRTLQVQLDAVTRERDHYIELYNQLKKASSHVMDAFNTAIENEKNIEGLNSLDGLIVNPSDIKGNAS